MTILNNSKNFDNQKVFQEAPKLYSKLIWLLVLAKELEIKGQCYKPFSFSYMVLKNNQVSSVNRN